jgi:hypothetical protein
MPYVRRDATQSVLSLHKQAEPEATEFLPDAHPDVLQFLGHTAGPEAQFARLDADFVRVLEDVIDTLISKHLLNITDLPAEAQAKLFSRKSFRERLSPDALQLFGDADVSGLMPLRQPDSD